MPSAIETGLKELERELEKQNAAKHKTELAIESLWDLETPPLDGSDPNELIRSRYICRGGGMMIAAPTGIGKSVFTLQCAIHWSFGLPAFGLVPTRPHRILLIQAENDKGDMAEMRDGIIKDFETPQNVNPDQVKNNLMVLQESALTGAAFFCNVVEPALDKVKPDILMIDPALSYIGGESNSQKDVGGFLRNGLNPLLQKHSAGCVIVHHTTKPPKGEEKSTWKAGDYAYIGSGSNEWANWARAVLAIRSLGDHDVFELVAGKRGSRLGWVDEQGERRYAKVIKHARRGICWVEGTDADRPGGSVDAPRQDKRTCSADDVLAMLPEEGMHRSEWVAACETMGSRSTIHARVSELIQCGKVYRSAVTGKMSKAYPPGTFQTR